MSSATTSPPSPSTNNLSITSKPYGHHCGQDVKEFTLSNRGKNNENTTGIEVSVIEYGAIITAVMTPDRQGKYSNVVLGYPTLSAWVSGKPWMNSLIGRNSNRITKGLFSIDGETYQLEQNDRGNNLHTSAQGFNAKIIPGKQVEGENKHTGRKYVGVNFSFVSPDGEWGFPGELHISHTIRLYNDSALEFEFAGEVKGKPTVLNMCNHSYWNLSGKVDEDKTSTVLDHFLEMNSSSITELDPPSQLPTGRIIPVANTPYDFHTQPMKIGSRLKQLDAELAPHNQPGGYDINFVLKKDHIESEKEDYHSARTINDTLRATFAGRLSDESSGRAMDVYTTAPGIQVYGGNWLDGESIVGRNNIAYPKYGAVCMETQTFPDSVNHSEDPVWKQYGNSILRPGEKHLHVTQHVFRTMQ